MKYRSSTLTRHIENRIKMLKEYFNDDNLVQANDLLLEMNEVERKNVTALLFLRCYGGILKDVYKIEPDDWYEENNRIMRSLRR